MLIKDRLFFKYLQKNKAFTLIELLIVIGILAILATATLLVLNPAQMVKQTRDTVRMSELISLNQALSLYETSGLTSLGSSNIVYISIPDSSATCANISGLPILPSGYAYSCKPSSTYRNVDGTGWVPVNFTQVSFGSPLSQLPIDPINTATNRNYYTYIPGGSWHLAANLEADKFKLGGSEDKTSKDNGSYPSLFETGSSLNLIPIDYGDTSLVGYWKFDEGSGTTAYDHSGNGRSASWSGTGAHYASGKIGSYSGQFNGVDDIVTAGIAALDDYSVSFWVYESQVNAQSVLLILYLGGTSFYTSYGGQYRVVDAPLNVTTPSTGIIGTSNMADFLNTWVYMVFTRNSSDTVSIYKNGIFQISGPSSSAIASSPTFRIGGILAGRDIIGKIDDLRIYNRALSADEILGFYNSTK